MPTFKAIWKSRYGSRDMEVAIWKSQYGSPITVAECNYLYVAAFLCPSKGAFTCNAQTFILPKSLSQRGKKRKEKQENKKKTRKESKAKTAHVLRD